MDYSRSRYVTGKFFLGLFLLGLGALFLFDNLGIIYIDHIGRLWPTLFIVFGLVKLFETDNSLERGNGIWWVFFGTWLLVSMNGYFGLDFHNSWPLLIVAWGVSMLWRGLYQRPQPGIAKEQDDGH